VAIARGDRDGGQGEALGRPETRMRSVCGPAPSVNRAASTHWGMPERMRTRPLLVVAIFALLAIGAWIAFATGYVNWPIWQT
jgi:hypothetical protein